MEIQAVTLFLASQHVRRILRGAIKPLQLLCKNHANPNWYIYIDKDV
jgi:hypothetical protein